MHNNNNTYLVLKRKRRKLSINKIQIAKIGKNKKKFEVMSFCSLTIFG